MSAARGEFTLVYEFPKNAREAVRVSHATFHDRDLIDIRAFYRAEDGEMRPSPRGISISRDLLPELEKAVAALRARAVE